MDSKEILLTPKRQQLSRESTSSTVERNNRPVIPVHRGFETDQVVQTVFFVVDEQEMEGLMKLEALPHHAQVAGESVLEREVENGNEGV